MNDISLDIKAVLYACTVYMYCMHVHCMYCRLLVRFCDPYRSELLYSTYIYNKWECILKSSTFMAAYFTQLTSTDGLDDCDQNNCLIYESQSTQPVRRFHATTLSLKLGIYIVLYSD